MFRMLYHQQKQRFRMLTITSIQYTDSVVISQLIESRDSTHCTVAPPRGNTENMAVPQPKTAMASIIQKLVRQAHDTFCTGIVAGDVGGGPSMAARIARLGAVASSVRASDVNLAPELVAPSAERAKTVTYVSVAEHEAYTVGIFVLGSDARLQLHDHPDMHGVLKVLHGRVRMDRYSHLPGNMVVGSNRTGQPLQYHVLRKPSVEMGVDDDAALITPTHNFHEIRPVGGPAAFLDVLGPPYAHGKRSCHYYKEAAGASNNVIILETPHPGDIEHQSAEYIGPSIAFPL